MAVITIKKKEFLNILGRKIKDDLIEETISKLGVSVEGINDNEIVLDILANRPDLLSQYGLARAVSNFLDYSEMNNYKINKAKYVVNVEKQCNDWPYAVTAVVKNLKLDDEKLKEIIQLQEKLGSTFLRNRKKGGLGIYPLDRIKFPVRFTSDFPEKIKFKPLDYPYPIDGKEILEKHPTGREYKHIVNNWKKFPAFIDADGRIMSMPPIINSNDLGKVTEETKDVFVEATGTDFNTINVALNILVTSLADMGGEVYSTKLVYKNKTYETPDLKPKEMKVDFDYINKQLGLDLNEKKIRSLLYKMGYGRAKKDDSILVPSYRYDVIHQTDIAEDAAIAYGYNNLKEEIPNITTIAQESEFEIFKRKICNILVGLGLLEVHTYNLAKKENQVDKMHTNIKVVELANSLNEEYNVLRAWLIPSMVQILKENKHHEYPQNIFCCGEVFKYDSAKQSGIGEAVRLSVVLCHNNSNFTEIKQVLDVLFKALDIRYEIREINHGSFIEGRVGRVSVKDSDIAYIGEIHPKVLEEFELDMPVAALELNLSDLFKIFNSSN